MSRGVNTARSSSESLFYSVTSIACVKGRAEHEQVAKLTARGRLLRAQFWVPVRIFQTSPGFFSHCKVELDFFRMKGPKSSHFSVLNFVTSGGVFSVLKSVEMCDQFLAWRAQCTSPPEYVSQSTYASQVFEFGGASAHRRRRRPRRPHQCLPVSPRKGTKMPPGLRSGSLAAEKAKCAALTEHVQLQQQEIERLGSLPFDPSKVPGLLDPTPHEVKKRARSQARVSQSEGGSATIRDLYVLAQANKQKREERRRGSPARASA